MGGGGMSVSARVKVILILEMGAPRCSMGPRTDVVDCSAQLDVTKVTWALCHALAARRAFKVAVDGAESGVTETGGLLYSRTDEQQGHVVSDLERT